jgi:hypothetical protein
VAKVAGEMAMERVAVRVEVGMVEVERAEAGVAGTVVAAVVAGTVAVEMVRVG